MDELVLPLFILAALTVLGIALITVFLPAIGNFFWIVGLGIMAYLTKDVKFYDTKNVSLSIGGVFGLLAIGFLAVQLLGLQLPELTASVFSLPLISSFSIGGVSTGNFDPASIGSLALVIVIIFASVFLLGKKFGVKSK